LECEIQLEKTET